MIQTRLFNHIPSCLLCLLFVGLSACTTQTSEPIAVAIDMPTRETDVLAKTTLVFSQSTASPAPTLTAPTLTATAAATETPTPTATLPPTAVPTEIALGNDQLPEQPAEDEANGEGINMTPVIPTSAPVQPTITPTSETEEPEPTTPQETITFDPTDEAPPVGPGEEETETPEAGETAEATTDAPTPTSTPTPVPNANSPAATPTATVALGEADNPNIQISVSSAQIPVDGTATIEVQIQRINAQLGEITLSLTYDGSVASLISCRMGDLTGICSPDGDGFISLTAVNNGNVQPDILLATLEYQAVSPGNSDVEVFQVDTAVNLEGEALTYITKSGSITVP